MTKADSISIKDSSLFWTLSPFIAVTVTLLLEFIRANIADNSAVAVLSLLAGLLSVVLFLVAPAIAIKKQSKQ